MNAQTAHHRAKKVLMQSIYKQIQDRINEGKFCLVIFNLNPVAKQILKSQGYEVTLGSSGACDYIEWHSIK